MLVASTGLFDVMFFSKESYVDGVGIMGLKTAAELTESLTRIQVKRDKTDVYNNCLKYDGFCERQVLNPPLCMCIHTHKAIR